MTVFVFQYMKLIIKIYILFKNIKMLQFKKYWIKIQYIYKLNYS